MKKILMSLSALILLGLGIFFLILLRTLVLSAKDIVLIGREILLLLLGATSFTFGLYLLGCTRSLRRK